MPRLRAQSPSPTAHAAVMMLAACAVTACAANDGAAEEDDSEESALIASSVATSQDQPCAISKDDLHVYWVTCGATRTVIKAAKAGGAPTQLAKPDHEPAAMAVDATHVYWVDRNTESSKTNGVRRVAKAGGALESLVDGMDDLAAIALTDTEIVASGSGGVFRLPKAGGTSTTVVAPTPPGSGYSTNAPYLATDGTTVFFTHGYGTTPVSAVPLAGGTVRTVASPRGAASLVVEGGFVFWMTDGKLEKAPVGGGNVTVVADLGLRASRSLSVDQEGACVGSEADRVVRCVRFATGAVSTVARAWPVVAPNRVSALVLDGADVWFADRGAMTSDTSLFDMAPSPVASSGSVKRTARQ